MSSRSIPVLPHGALYQQGDGDSDCGSGHGGHHRQNHPGELGYEPGLQPEADYYAVKMPVFSFEKIRGAEISLGPEMKSTGECLGIAKDFNEALYKAFLGAGVNLPKHKNIIITVKDADKHEVIEIGRHFEKLGYTIYATKSTAAALNEAGVKARKSEQNFRSPHGYGSDTRTQNRSGH